MTQRETFILKLLHIRQSKGWQTMFSLRNIKSDEAQTFHSAEELAAFLKDENRHREGKQPDDEL